jgi:hypothetical protein
MTDPPGLPPRPPGLPPDLTPGPAAPEYGYLVPAAPAFGGADPLVTPAGEGAGDGTSFTTIGRNLGAALGRMALLLVMIYGVQVLLTIPIQLLSGLQPRPVAIGPIIALQFVIAPLTLVPTVGSTLLFAELFNRQTPLTVTRLEATLTPAG